MIDIPAGGLDTNETIIDCVKREVLEETGVTIQNPTLKAVFQVIGSDITTINFLFTETLSKFPFLNNSKPAIGEDISDIYFLPIKEIKEKIYTEPKLFEHALALKRLEILLARNMPVSSPFIITLLSVWLLISLPSYKYGLMGRLPLFP